MLTQQRFVGADNGPVRPVPWRSVAEVDAAAGDVTPVNVLGIVAVEAGAAIAKGQNVQSDENACAVLRQPHRARPRRAFRRDCAG
ncbi:MAG: DUF2190 family protein [Escherichia coli]